MLKYTIDNDNTKDFEIGKRYSLNNDPILQDHWYIGRTQDNYTDRFYRVRNFICSSMAKTYEEAKERFKDFGADVSINVIDNSEWLYFKEIK